MEKEKYNMHIAKRIDREIVILLNFSHLIIATEYVYTFLAVASCISKIRKILEQTFLNDRT